MPRARKLPNRTSGQPLRLASPVSSPPIEVRRAISLRPKNETPAVGSPDRHHVDGRIEGEAAQRVPTQIVRPEVGLTAIGDGQRQRPAVWRKARRSPD